MELIIISVVIALGIFLFFTFLSKYSKKEDYLIDVSKPELPIKNSDSGEVESTQSLEKDIAERDILINEYTNNIVYLKKDITDKDILIDNYTKEISNMNSTILELNNIIKDKNLKITLNNKQLASSKNEINKLTKELTEKNKQSIKYIYRYDNPVDNTTLSDSDMDRILNNEEVEKYTSINDIDFDKNTNDILDKIHNNIEADEIGMYIIHQSESEGKYIKASKKRQEAINSFVNRYSNKNGRYKTYIVVDDKLYVYDLLREFK